jgi:flagellar basal body rod protein FlgG
MFFKNKSKVPRENADMFIRKGELFMADVSGIAATALTAFGVRQGVTGNNVANLDSNGFKASSAVMQESKNGGVNAGITQGSDSVEISREAVNMLDTVNGNKANLKTLHVADEMTKELLNIMA